VNTAATFSPTTGKITNLPTQLGGTGGRLGFGATNSIRGNVGRVLQIAVKLSF